MRSGPYITLTNLRIASRLCLESGDEHLRWLGQSLETFLSHRYRSLEEAFDLRFPRGGVPWWREAEMRVRDAALRQLAERHLWGLSTSDRVRRLRNLAARYEASSWRFDRNLEAMPLSYAGTAKEYLWLAFNSGAPMPLGERRLRSILSEAPNSAQQRREAT